jgi:hypothetical protein
MGTLNLSISKSVHTSIYPIFLRYSCSLATSEHPEPLPLENCVGVVALTLDLQRVSFYSALEFLQHSSTIDLLLYLILIKVSYLSSYSLTTMREMVISLVAAMVRKFMNGRHANQYLESKLLTDF